MNTATIPLESLRDLGPHEGDRIEGVIQGDYALVRLVQEQPYVKNKAEAIDRFIENWGGAIPNPTKFSVDSNDPRLAYLAKKHLA